MKNIILYLLFAFGIQQLSAQETFTRKDSLQGGLRIERTSFDVLHYDLNIKINIVEKSIAGYNEIRFKTIDNTNTIQLDLFDNMQVDSIVYNSKKLQYKRDFNAVFINFENSLIKNSEHQLRFYYSGKPLVAKHAPWDGGFVWQKDLNGKDWVGVAVQGTGASLWYPVKDSQSDEPDFGASIKVAVPNGLMNISNGRFMGSTDLKNGYTRWDWEVKNPINTYDITLNIGDYVHFGENYKGLDLDYYVLRENLEKAKIQFEQVKPMMDCFQSKFGEYPFKNDGYKLVETHYLGMEHQSAVAYGNKYQNGYLGNDLSGTGVGLLFDFIIIHESGHEWFGNSITSKDIADMWIHEGFTQYTESVFVECQYGYEKGQIYINGLQENVRNDKPIIGKYGVNKEGSGDMYPKGALMLNTLRHVVNDDAKWWNIILKYSETFRHQIIDTEMVIAFFSRETGMNLTTIFNQYLKYEGIPLLDLKRNKDVLEYKWRTDVTDFNMPIDIKLKGKTIRLHPTNNWIKSKYKIKDFSEVEVLKNNFFINVIEN
ncbi:M1 family metallopeptidase [Flavobacterium sp. GT3R68]|uniref:M1 family metallopeptidase n=1 Tax=Flavobacterium sp. GT3R68 TaxID=2594437 RepID=UPI000F874738|nr:M1 family metallopeptidase [Flavobacterium sp. GT3R68]RTY94903.1 M1 family peptidase [Flavobacterium sp. GSN2]TRW91707.1 M1 family metallopeptidase [Flavobacterium sp. GT3R68]